MTVTASDSTPAAVLAHRDAAPPGAPPGRAFIVPAAFRRQRLKFVSGCTPELHTIPQGRPESMSTSGSLRICRSPLLAAGRKDDRRSFLLYLWVAVAEDRSPLHDVGDW